MAHVKSSARVLGHNPTGLEDFDPVEDERGRLTREIAESPAMQEVVEYLTHAKLLGLDVSDPEVIERARVAGERARADRLAAASRRLDYRLFAEVGLDDRHEPVVYYMRNGDQVKIGTSIHLADRIQTLSPQGVLAIEPGNEVIERQRHRQFAPLRLRGEWFQMDESIASHVAALRDKFEAETGESTEAWLGRHTSRSKHQPRPNKRSAPTRIKLGIEAVVPLPGRHLPADARDLVVLGQEVVCTDS